MFEKYPIPIKYYIPIGAILGGLVVALICYNNSSKSQPCCNTESKYIGIRTICCGDVDGDIERITNNFNNATEYNDYRGVTSYDIRSVAFFNALDDGNGKFKDYQMVLCEFGLDSDNKLKIIFTPAITCTDSTSKSESHFDENLRSINNYDEITDRFASSFPYNNTNRSLMRRGYYIGIERLKEILKSCITRYTATNLRLSFGLTNTYERKGQLTFYLQGLDNDGKVCDSITYHVSVGDDPTDGIIPRLKVSP